LPVAPAPLRSPPGIHRHRPQPSVGGHPDQQLPERSGRYARHHAAEGLAASTAPEGLPASVAGVGEVQVLHHDRPAAVRLGELHDGGNRRPQPAVAGPRRQPVKLERDRMRRSDRVAAYIQHPAVQMPGIQIDSERPVLAQLLQRRHLPGREPPGRIGVPAAPGRVQQQVVADRARGCLRRPLAGPVGERHGARQPVGRRSARGVGQVRQRGRQADLQPLLVRVDADGFIPPHLAGLAVGGEEPPLGPPPGAPLGLGHPGHAAVLAVLAALAVTDNGVTGDRVVELGEPAAAAAHRHPTLSDPRLDRSQPGQQMLHAPLLLEPLRLAAIPLHPATASRLPCRDCQARPGLLDPAA